jgi:hypothetical protein
LTEAKPALALHADNPEAMKLLEEYVRDPENREDLLAGIWPLKASHQIETSSTRTVQ